MKIDPNSIARQISEAASQAVAEIRNKSGEVAEPIQKLAEKQSCESKEAAQKWGEARKEDMNLAAGILSRELSNAVSSPEKKLGVQGIAKAAIQTSADLETLGVDAKAFAELGVRPFIGGSLSSEHGKVSGEASGFVGLLGEIGAHGQLLDQVSIGMGGEAFAGAKAKLEGDVETKLGEIGAGVEAWAGVGVTAKGEISGDKDAISVGGRLGAGLGIGGAVEGDLKINLGNE